MTLTNEYNPPVVEEAKGKTPMAKVIRGAILGTVVEYYDFGIYGYMATILAVHFFQGNETTALLGTFATFAVAFFMRIPGGIYFGHIGDKYGRKKALTWTILLMAVATALMGLLPTYATLGIWATVLLVLSRCLQGFAAGGELGGANAFVSEYAPTKKRASFTSMVNSGTYIGSLLASLMALALTTFVSIETIDAWAWRIPFLLSVVIGFIGLYIRNSLEDSPEFEKMEDSEEKEALPIKVLLTESGSKVLNIIALGAMITGGYYIASVYAATYLQVVGGHTSTLAYTSTCIAMICGVITLPIAGRLADKIGRKPLFLTGSILGVILGYPAFLLMSLDNPFLAAASQSVLFVLVSLVNGASFAAYAEMLPTRTRYSGIALANNTSNTLLGGTAPFIATLLISQTGQNIAPAYYFIGCCAVTVIAALIYQETKGQELPL
ncbi:MFS transporter [Corynebacterium crudilactis]